MKRILLFCLSIFVCHSMYAQQPAIVRCVNMADQEKMLQAKDPTRKARRDAAENQMNQWMANQSMYRTQNVETEYTLPIVFHVVFNTAAEEISYAQIKSQVEVINLDYNRRNSDTVNTPTPFKSVAANFHITFCLAQRDPNGWITTGVVYKRTTVTGFTNDDAVKKPSLGGDTIWDPNKYLNIWICNLGGGLLGYSEFPTMPLDNTFGSVINYVAVGDTGYLPYSQYNLGRTVTHEIGHLLNLIHPWGDDGGLCPPPLGSGSDDGCADTPPEGNNKSGDGYGSGAGPTFGKPPFPYTDNCSTTSPGIMVENYMEYTDDAEMNLFTNDQYTRALAALNGPLDSLITSSNGCVPGGIGEITFSDAMSIYPNPSYTGRFNVHIGLTNFSHINVTVYNIMGQTVDTWSSDDVSNSTYDLDLSHQPSGLYFAKIYTNEFSVVKKIMISR